MDNNVANHVEARDRLDCLFRAHAEDLRRYAESFGLAQDDAEDIVAEIFASLWFSRGRWRPEGMLLPYLFRSVHNACVDCHRRRKKLRPLNQGIRTTERSSGDERFAFDEDRR